MGKEQCAYCKEENIGKQSERNTLMNEEGPGYALDLGVSVPTVALGKTDSGE